jgi:hypothetical protein
VSHHLGQIIAREQRALDSMLPFSLALIAITLLWLMFARYV